MTNLHEVAQLLTSSINQHCMCNIVQYNRMWTDGPNEYALYIPLTSRVPLPDGMGGPGSISVSVGALVTGKLWRRGSPPQAEAS